MSTPEQQLAVLTDKLNALENESRRILRALQWATKVRMILFCALLMFVLVSLVLFYRLYVDVRYNRIALVQQTIEQQPERFSEPLTRQIMLLAEEQGPHVVEVFRAQAVEDSDVIVQALNQERTVLINNLQENMEQKLAVFSSSLLDEQEKLLVEEFPVLKDPEKMENVRKNMEKVYQQFAERYYVDFMKEELEEMAVKLDAFPPTEPKMANISIAEQIALEFIELVRMTVVYADKYVFSDDPAGENGVPDPEPEAGISGDGLAAADPTGASPASSAEVGSGSGGSGQSGS